MKKLILTTFTLLSLVVLKAQKNIQPLELKRKDSLIAADIINPAVRQAISDGEEPDWNGLFQQVSKLYDDVYADRTITRAEIYYYYQRNWPAFAAAITNYTEKFEDKTNAAIMNTNANFILKYSENKSEIEKAIEWIKLAVAADDKNQVYKDTFRALEKKRESL